MATYLYRIGRFAYRRKGTVLSIWLAILVLMGVGAATLSGPTKDSFSIPGTPAQEAQDLMSERFGDQKSAMDALSARFVIAAPAGQTLDTPENQAAMDEMLADIRGIEKVSAPAKADPASGTPGALVNPVTADAALAEMAKASAEEQGVPEDVALANARALSSLSEDRTVGYIESRSTATSATSTKSMRDQIQAAADIGRDAGLNVQISGSAATEAEMPGGVTELIGIAVAAIVLVITFGSLVAAGLPLITAIIGIMIGSLGITVATGFMDLSSMTPTLAIMIGLAVAIDYSLFIVSRFKHELSLTTTVRGRGPRGRHRRFRRRVRRPDGHHRPRRAARRRHPFLSDMGAAAASTVFIAVLIALTLLPRDPRTVRPQGLRRSHPRLSQRDAEGDDGKKTFSQRYGRAVVRRPRSA